MRLLHPALTTAWATHQSGAGTLRGKPASAAFGATATVVGGCMLLRIRLSADVARTAPPAPFLSPVQSNCAPSAVATDIDGTP
ncbi:hypothetical protein EIQ13_07020 [Xanthomonas campestris pv. campestris]